MSGASEAPAAALAKGAKATKGVYFANILQAAFKPISFIQKMQT